MFKSKILRSLFVLAVTSIASQGLVHASDEARERAEKILKRAAVRAANDFERSKEKALTAPHVVQSDRGADLLKHLAEFVRAESDFDSMPIPKNIFTEMPQPKTSHVSSIGEVILERYRGTGTYVGGNIVISASHVISCLFNGKVPTAHGPHYINLKGKYAYWRFDPKRHKDGRVDGKARSIRIVGLVAESMYINGVNHGDKQLSHNQQKYDISFLILDSTQTAGLPEMQVIDSAKAFNPMCAMMGYAPLKGGQVGRHKVVVKLTVNSQKEEWDVLHLLKDFNISPSEKGRMDQEAESLLGTKLPGGVDGVSDIIRGGDSGGPLIVKTADGRKIQIGVNSVSTDPVPGGFSGCASLMMGSHKHGWVISPKVKAMWDYAKAMQQQYHK